MSESSIKEVEEEDQKEDQGLTWLHSDLEANLGTMRPSFETAAATTTAIVTIMQQQNFS